MNVKTNIHQDSIFEFGIGTLWESFIPSLIFAFLVMEFTNGGRVVHVKKPELGKCEAYYAIRYFGVDWWKHEVKDLERVRVEFTDKKSKAVVFFEGQTASFQDTLWFPDDSPAISSILKSELQSLVDRTNQLISSPQYGTVNFHQTYQWHGLIAGGFFFLILMGMFPYKIKGTLNFRENRITINRCSILQPKEKEFDLHLIKEFQIQKTGMQSYGIFMDHFSYGNRLLFKPGLLKKRHEFTENLNQILTYHRSK